jgi:HPt (histidine-containing phosphotransfer) domain-containing protein
MPTPPSFEEFLAQQRAGYRASLPARLATLQAAWADLEAAAAPAAAADVAAAAESLQAPAALQRCAHGLAGSAATFGLAALGDAARALEDWLETAPARWDAQAQAAAKERLQALQDLLRQAIAG